MNFSQSTLNLIGRVLLVALFLPAGIDKLTGFSGTVGYFSSLGMPAPSLGVVVAIIVEIIGGLTLLVGYRTRIAAVVLAVFTLSASVAGHAYWAAPADQAFMQQLLFFKNIAVVGGLLILAASGAGKFSVDRFRASK